MYLLLRSGCSVTKLNSKISHSDRSNMLFFSRNSIFIFNCSGEHSKNKKQSKYFESYYNNILYRSSPIPNIYSLACIPLLDIRRLKITLNHELKLASTIDFNPKFKMLPILLQENNLDISSVLTITPSLAPQWKNLNETNTELSILKKTTHLLLSTNKNIFT